MNTAVRTGYVHPSLRSNADDLKPLGTGPLPPVITPPMLGAVRSYKALVDLVVTEAPVGGYGDPQQLPRLDDTHHALIARERVDALDGLTFEPQEVADLFDDRASARASPLCLSGLFLDRRVLPLLRRALFWDVQVQFARDEDIRLASAADERANKFYRSGI